MVWINCYGFKELVEYHLTTTRENFNVPSGGVVPTQPGNRHQHARIVTTLCQNAVKFAAAFYWQNIQTGIQNMSHCAYSNYSMAPIKNQIIFLEET
jgi:hypothetical protein